jgi:hypothetical protein
MFIAEFHGEVEFDSARFKSDSESVFQNAVFASPPGLGNARFHENAIMTRPTENSVEVSHSGEKKKNSGIPFPEAPQFPPPTKQLL